MEKDERDFQYPFRRVIPTSWPTYIKRKMWTPGPVLNQGRTSMCVGFGQRALLSATPVPVPPNQAPSAQDIYWLAVTRDDNPYNDRDPNSGTSVRAGMRALQEMGRVGSYLWEYSSYGVANWILRHGPVGLGIPWYEGQNTLDAGGFIHPTGRLLGGHYLVAYGADTEKRTFRLINSWSTAWGLAGTCFITFDDLDFLLERDGEAVAATERRLA